jgi:hypothetical protein
MATNDPYGFANYFADATQPQQAPYNGGQLDWIAAINGQTPQQYLQTQAAWQANGGQRPLTAQQQWTNNGLSGQGFQDALWRQEQDENATRAMLDAQTNATNNGLGVMFDGYDPIINQSRDRANYLQGINGQMGQQVAGQAATSNAMRSGALGNYGNAVGAAGAWDMQNFSGLVSAANAPMQMTASAYVGDAQSNPADLARELQAYNQLAGAASGNLDQLSQASRAYADAQDIGNQRHAAGMLANAGQGGLDVNLDNVHELNRLRDPDSIGGMSDLYAASNGSKDIHVGQEDPAAYAAAVDARNQLQALTNPQVTAQEKLMYELSRQQQEQDERGTREALQTDAQRRGVSGVGTEIARSALGAQQTSRNRMLQDMQANSQAQARAMQALQGYGTISTNMTAQANQIAGANQQTQMNALGQYTGIHANSASVLGQLGANNATQNANRQLAAQQAAYDAYATLRAQGFSEEYARGQAYDAMANANANRQLGAMQSQGQMANNMRQEGDAMSRYNQGQRQQQSQFSDSYAANRQDAAYGRQVDVFNGGNTVGRNFMTDQGNLFNATTGVADSNFNTINSSVNTQAGLNGQWLGAQQTTDGQALGALGAKAGIIQTQLGNNQTRAANNTTFGTNAVQRQTNLHNLGVEQRGNAAQAAAFPGGASVTTNGVGAQSASTPIGYTGWSTNPNDPNWFGRDASSP